MVAPERRRPDHQRTVDTTAPDHYPGWVRLSITLDDELYAVARSLAKAEDCSISAAINRLLRQAIERPPARGIPQGPPRSTFPTSAGKRMVTEVDVKAIEDEP